MIKSIWLIGGAILLSSSAYAQSVRVCHYPGIIELADHKTTDIPKGSSFVEEISVPGHDARMGAVARTTKGAKLPAKPACVTIPLNHPLKGHILPQFAIPGLTIKATAVP